MKIIDKSISVSGRSSEIEIYPLGDLHIGSRSCAENKIKKVVKDIQDNPNAYWFGGGDYLDAIKPMDAKRFDMDTLPDWMLEGDSDSVRDMLNDILNQQFIRLDKILQPIKDKCLFCLEGNHEYSIRKYHNQDINKTICESLGAANGTDEVCVRLTFSRGTGCSVVKLYACHGHGGGRSCGSEPGHLHGLLSEWEDADILFRGHSHTYHIIPPKPVLYLPNRGKLPKELHSRYRHAANWGCWLFSHPTGSSTYASRACYPARPMVTCKAVIKPFNEAGKRSERYTQPHIEIRSITL
jgi:predicted phosphodiesterase